MSKKNNSTKTALVRVDYNVPIKNGQILDLKRIEASLPTINYLINQDISNFMIGRQFSKDILFIEKIGLCDLKNKKIPVLKFLSDIKLHKFLNINLIKKSIFTLLKNISNSKSVRKDISNIKNLELLSSYFEETEIWT